jgi:ABC-2 type transport system ATP-binding protein
MEEAERLADDVVIVDHGRVIATGTAEQLIRGAAEREVRFQAVPGLDVDALTAALPGGSRVHEPTPGTYLVVGPVTPGLVAAVAAWCAAHDVLLGGLQVKQRTLEDVFLELTGRELRA